MPSLSLCASIVALVLSSGVAAWAGGAVDDNSVTSETIADGAVRASDMAAGGVTQAKLAGDSVGTEEIVGKSIQSDEVQAGSVVGDLFAPQTLGDREIQQTKLSTIGRVLDDAHFDGIDDEYINGNSYETIASVTVPVDGPYVVLASADFANDIGDDDSVFCRVFRNGVNFTGAKTGIRLNDYGTAAPAAIHHNWADQYYLQDTGQLEAGDDMDFACKQTGEGEDGEDISVGHRHLDLIFAGKLID